MSRETPIDQKSSIDPSLGARMLNAARNFPRTIFAKGVDATAGALAGAVLTAAVFVVSSHTTPAEEQKSELRSQIISHISKLNLVREGTAVDIDFIDVLKLSFNSDAIVLHGKYDPIAKPDGAMHGQKSSLFFAIFEDSDKSIVDAILKREPTKKLSAFLTFDGIGDDRKISELRAEDCFGDGQKAILFDIIQFYADGRSISPIILARRRDKWELTLLPDMDKEAREAFLNAANAGVLKLSADNKRTLFDDYRHKILNKYAQERITFTEMWNLNFNNVVYSLMAIRNSSGYRYYRHPSNARKQIFLLLSLQDNSVLAPHHVYISVLALEHDNDRTSWAKDTTWFGGNGSVSAKAQDYQAYNFDLIYSSGYNRDESGVYWWGPSFTKELQ
ncbi:MAG: hypothetical protein ACR65U_14375 [Methylocystis sp.]